ncbi:MAG TPA: ATP-binding protein [Pyrinomonadaceae bacterium]|jgi:two-component system chemotaxis sensor kinase CheA
MDEPLAQDFIAQAEELIESLSADVQDLRAARAPDARARRALVDRAFRHAHTLKGTASSHPRLEAASRLAHELESLLEAVRAGRTEADDDALDACDEACDALSRLVESAARGAGAPATDEIVARLRSSAARGGAAEGFDKAAGETSAAVAEVGEGIASQLNARERRRLAQVVGAGARAALVEVDFDLADFDERFRRLTDALAEAAEIVATLPAAEGLADGRIGFRVLCAHDAPEKLSPLLAPFGARLVAPATGTKTATRGAPRSTEAPRAAEDARGEETPPETGGREEFRTRPGAGGDDAAAAGAAAPVPSFVRVQLSELDDLIFAANELFDDTMRALGAASPAESAPRLRRDFVVLVERVMALRMQTLTRTLERAARAARVGARRAGKRVEIEVEGGEARVDRAVAERLGEPLTHLLANAVAHGVEPPAERRAAGKSERGRVRIAVSTGGGLVSVRVADDGRGVDIRRIEEAARAAGIIDEGARVSEGQALRLIFRPGFSTAADVSMASGRGVGLDAVEHEIERAGGEVRVRTRRGRGTTFELRLPLPLALVPALLVRAGAHTYALDAGRVEEVLTLEEAGADAHSRTILRQGEELPLVSLSALLTGQPPSPGRRGEPAARGGALREGARRGDDAAGDEARRRVVIVRRDDGHDDDAAAIEEVSPRLAALVVDESAGRRDALVRSLGRHATRWRGVSGAIDLRDGVVALMLDLPRLLEVMRDEG